MTILTLTPETLPDSHICCAMSDRRYAAGTEAKKRWLAETHAQGYRFSRLDERGKVLIEYGPGAEAWQPVVAPDWMVMGCFWVSGRFKQQGHGKALLGTALEAARGAGLAGLVAVVGPRKLPFLSDGAWLRRQGFHEVDATDSGFSLLALGHEGAAAATAPRFADSARRGLPAGTRGLTVFYSDRCPFTEFHIGTALRETCAKRGLSPTIVKLDSREKAQNAPSPATIFSLFAGDRFVTNDLSVCLDHRFDAILAKAGVDPAPGL